MINIAERPAEADDPRQVGSDESGRVRLIFLSVAGDRLDLSVSTG